MAGFDPLSAALDDALKAKAAPKAPQIALPKGLTGLTSLKRLAGKAA